MKKSEAWNKMRKIRKSDKRGIDKTQDKEKDQKTENMIRDVKTQGRE